MKLGGAQIGIWWGGEDRSACGRGSYRKTGFLVLGFEASKRKERIKKEKTEKRERKEV